jgi:lysophospholipase L1-like esterase
MRPISPGRALLFRVASVLLGLSPFLAIEVLLRVLGIGQPDLRHDPFVGFSRVRPLFVRSESKDRYEIAPSRLSHFFPDSFAGVKPADEFRIFCIGDSTVQGNPWTPETSFTTWLEITLTAADPARRWNVINCGGISYASYRMVPILEEVLHYQPDLVVVHCSHNEFLEDRSYAALKLMPDSLWRLEAAMQRLRLYQVLRRWSSVARRRPALGDSPRRGTAGDPDQFPPVLPEEVQALLDYRDGLERYHHDAQWQHDVVAHYAFNLRRMATLARQAEIPLILLNPACNLRDSPPFKAEHRPNLTHRERQQWTQLWSAARDQYATNPRKAVELLRNAIELDDRHAGLHYDLAKCLDVLRDFPAARFEYVRAKETDVCPLRILEPMRVIVRDVGRETETPVVDLGALFDGLSRDGIPGDGWFVDHVHPTIAGYQRVADALADEMVRGKFLQPAADWHALRTQRYSEHLDKLPAMYFVSAQRRLDSLQLWARGRARRELPQ